MTEAEWLAATDPEMMFRFLRDRGLDRKLHLFAVAYLRQLWHLLADDRSRAAVETIERFADGLASREELRQAQLEAAAARGEEDSDTWQAAHAVFEATSPQGWFAGWVTGRYTKSIPHGVSRTPQRMLLLREVVGNLFRPVPFDPRWRTADALGLARAAYEDRAFDRLPLLADALMDAGCDADAILAHCRGPGPHVRGCWVVDLVLGKE
jgi:hypothetical protein